jgi:dienelactone hydrolase
MKPHQRQLCACAVIAVLVTACGAASTPAPTVAPSPPTGSPPAAASSPAVTSSPEAAPSPTMAAAELERDIQFESSNDLNPTGVLDRYTPATGGHWPVVVMFHGDPASVDKQYLQRYALAVAGLGYLVYAPTWGKPGGDAYRALSITDRLLAGGAQAACAVEFARADAAANGGDASTLVLFGHSAGGNMAAQVAFARPAPTPGCLGGHTLGTIDGLVTWEGDWLLGNSAWDGVLGDAPELMEAITPWAHLAEQPNLPVAMVVSEHTFARAMPDATAVDAFLAPRDPTGSIRATLEAEKALDDGMFGLDEEQTLLYDTLHAQGNPVTLDLMPDSSHESLGDAGWPVFLEAFQKVTAAPG